MPEPRPTDELIDDTAAYLSELFADTWKEWYKVDALFHRTFAVWPEGVRRREYRPSTPTNIIDHAADNQLSTNPKIHREPLGGSEEQKQAADRVEVALTAIFQAAQLLEPVLTFKQVGRYLIHYGYTVLEGPIWSHEGKEKPPKRGPEESDEEFEARERDYEASLKGWNPLRLRAVHPASVLMDPFTKVPSVAIKRTMRFAKDVEALAAQKKKVRRHVDLFDMTGHKDYEPVALLEYWTPGWHSVKVEGGKHLYTELNDWGFVPFSQAFSGWGQAPTGQSLSPTSGTKQPLWQGDIANPKYLAVGLLNSVADSIRIHAQNASAKHNLLIRAAYAQMATTGDAQEIVQQMAAGDEAVIRLDDPNALWVTPTVEYTRWMQNAGAEVEADIEEGTYRRTIAGGREAGVDTVGQQVLMANQTQKKFHAPNMQLEALASLAAQRILRLVYTRNRTITVDGTELRPADIKGNFNATVRFEVRDPVIAMQEREIGMREVTMGLKSEETYRAEDARIANESREQERLLEDKVRKHPLVIAALAAMTARRMGPGFEEAADLIEAEAGITDSSGRTPVAQPKPEPVPTGIMGPDGEPLNFPATNGAAGSGQNPLDTFRRALGPESLQPKRTTGLNPPGA